MNGRYPISEDYKGSILGHLQNHYFLNVYPIGRMINMDFGHDEDSFQLTPKQLIQLLNELHKIAKENL